MENDDVPAGSRRVVVDVTAAEEEEDAGAGAAPRGSSSSTSGAQTSACEQQQQLRNKRRKLSSSNNGGSDEEEFEYLEIADAIHKFTEAYIKIETTKIESKRNAIDHETSMATRMMEMEERRYKCMMETQIAMAKLIAEAVKGALDRCLDSRGA